MNTKHIRFVFAIIFLFLFPYTSLISQEKIDTTGMFDISLDELLNVEINVASNIVTEIQKQPVSISSISNEELILSGARTLADAIMIYVPGFFLVEDQDDVIAGFRGLAPDNNSKVMLLINGQNINTEWFWGPPSVILNSMNYDYIEKIEIIRGPGSVVLGQGAMLGVINIVTKSGNYLPKNAKEGTFSYANGLNKYNKTSGDFSIHQANFHQYTYFARSNYDGQLLRNEGWAKDKKNEGYEGGKVFEIGTRLKKTANNQLFSSLNYKRLSFHVLYADQEKDLYNFYRDRNVFLQKLISLSTIYNFHISNKITIKTSINATSDNFGLKSVDGYILGGTRENRFNGKIIANMNELFPGNKLALGVEYSKFMFGRENHEGNNFIINAIDTTSIKNYSAYLTNANIENIWGYNANLNVLSAFFENYYSINKYLDLFIAFRFDNHEYWGNNLSPRLGLNTMITQHLSFRLSYQVGFRGAVGLHYGGGFLGDGLLSAENYDKIEDAQIPVFNENGEMTGEFEQNISSVEPEKMQSIELGMNYLINKNLNINTVFFYNNIANVIDVGVMYKDPSVYSLPSIGNDIPGDWNGYWYFKNNAGKINQYGCETILTSNFKFLILNISHALVMLANPDEQKNESMYITNEKKIKAYPENVTRINITTSFSQQIKFGAHYLYYYYWNSPNGRKVQGNHLLNLSALMNFSDHLSGNFSIINLLGQKQLYPMNNNADDAILSDGTPSVESTSFWIGLKYNF